MVRRLSLLMFVIGCLLHGQRSKNISSYGTETVLIESFKGDSVYLGTDIPLEWEVRSSKETAMDYPKTLVANTWPVDKYGESPESSESLKAFSVHASFQKRGYNWFEVNPVREVDGKQKIIPALLPGIVERVSVWVWGSNYNHTLEAVLVDAVGIHHRISMGKLDFFGWKNMHALIPAHIEQFSKKLYHPNLKLKGFLLTTNPSEDSSNFYVYFSDVTVTTVDKRYYDFDGSDLINAQTIADLWGEDINQILGGLGPDSNPLDVVLGQEALPPIVGSDNPAYQKLQEVSIGDFSNPTAWVPSISSDFGSIILRSVDGGPTQSRTIAGDSDGEQGSNDSEKQSEEKTVLGGKVAFLKRGLTPIQVISANPIDVNGIVKVVNVWVSGRNVSHKMSLLLRDWDGRIFKLYMGKLNFMGWRQISVAIPQRIKQRGFTNTRVGLQVLGFEIDTDLIDSRGDYYFYLNDLRAWIDVSAFPVGGGQGDPVDSW